jgi:hypothetical protein
LRYHNQWLGRTRRALEFRHAHARSLMQRLNVAAPGERDDEECGLSPEPGADARHCVGVPSEPYDPDSAAPQHSSQGR